MGGLWDEIRTALHGVWQRRWIAVAVAWAVCLAGWLARAAAAALAFSAMASAGALTFTAL